MWLTLQRPRMSDYSEDSKKQNEKENSRSSYSSPTQEEVKEYFVQKES